VKPPAQPLPINFQNGVAVRVAFFNAILVWILATFPIGGTAGLLLMPVIVGSGGFLSVLFYTKSTGEFLSVSSGARMGWITGVFVFAIFIVFITAGLLVASYQGIDLVAASRKALEEAKTPSASIEMWMEVMRSPGSIAVMVVLGAAIYLGMITLPMIVGGAVAAKMLDRGQTST
jgi:hypothetical protein